MKGERNEIQISLRKTIAKLTRVGNLQYTNAICINMSVTFFLLKNAHMHVDNTHLQTDPQNVHV